MLQAPGTGSRSESENGVDAETVLLWMLSEDRKQHHQHLRCGEHSNDSNFSHAPAAFTPGNIPVTHPCKSLSHSQGHSVALRVMSIKNSNDTIGNRTRDLPACSAVPQPNAPPSAPPRFCCRAIIIAGNSTIQSEW